MRKNMVMDLIYRGFIYAANYSESHYNPRRSQIKTDIRFLSGIDIFSRNTDYYAAYDQINGVQPASPIMIRGVKVGTVTGISFQAFIYE